MKEIRIDDMGPEAFRDAVLFFADSRNEFSKEELQSAFVVVTRLYLDELINARQLENLFVKKFGEASSKEFFEAVANSSDTVNDGYDAISVESAPLDVRKTQFDIIDKLNREN